MAKEDYNRKEYEDALQNISNRTFNGDLIRSKHMKKYVLAPRWPGYEWGWFTDADMPLRMTDAGGFWKPLTVSMWTEFEVFNKAVAERHGLTESNGCLKLGTQNICWRPKWFGEKLMAVSNRKANERLAGKVEASQEQEVNQRVGRKVTTARVDEEYERAKQKAYDVETTPELIEAHTPPKIQVQVPAMPKKAVPKKKPGRPKSKPVDKPAETP